MLKKLIHGSRARVKELQRSDDATKKRWLISGSVLALFLITSGWVLYLNVSLPRVDGVRSVAEIEVDTEEVSKESVLDVFTRGINEITKRAGGLWASIEGAVNKGREFEIIK